MFDGQPHYILTVQDDASPQTARRIIGYSLHSRDAHNLAAAYSRINPQVLVGVRWSGDSFAVLYRDGTSSV